MPAAGLPPWLQFQPSALLQSPSYLRLWILREDPFQRQCSTEPTGSMPISSDIGPLALAPRPPMHSVFELKHVLGDLR